MVRDGDQLVRSVSDRERMWANISQSSLELLTFVGLTGQVCTLLIMFILRLSALEHDLYYTT